MKILFFKFTFIQIKSFIHGLIFKTYFLIKHNYFFTFWNTTYQSSMKDIKGWIYFTLNKRPVNVIKQIVKLIVVNAIRSRLGSRTRAHLVIYLHTHTSVVWPVMTQVMTWSVTRACTTPTSTFVFTLLATLANTWSIQVPKPIHTIIDSCCLTQYTFQTI